MERVRFNDLEIGDVFRVGVTNFGHIFVKIGNFRPGHRLDDQKANAIDTETNHLVVFGGLTEVIKEN